MVLVEISEALKADENEEQEADDAAG